MHYLKTSVYESCCIHLDPALLQLKLKPVGYILPEKLFQMTVKVLLVTVDMDSPCQVCKMYFAN